MTIKPADVETLQHPFELDIMLALFEKQKPARVLEIGVWQGGTLWHWLQAGVEVVAVDNLMVRTDDWERWADEAGATLHLVPGDSASTNVVAAVRELGPYGFIFIDGDHGYQAVKTDWENYRQMLAPGGVVVFHDVSRSVADVRLLWAEVKNEPGARTVEILDGPDTYRGIGAIWPA